MTNTVSVGKVYDGLFQWQIEQAHLHGTGDDFEDLRTLGIPVVGETYDGMLNNIGASVIDKDSVFAATEAPQAQTEVLEGNYGGGTAMRCHGWKGGTGTSSRIIPGDKKDYTLGVLVQANHGTRRDLKIANVPIGELLARAKKDAEAQKLPVSGKAAEGSA